MAPGVVPRDGSAKPGADACPNGIAASWDRTGRKPFGSMSAPMLATRSTKTQAHKRRPRHTRRGPGSIRRMGEGLGGWGAHHPASDNKTTEQAQRFRPLKIFLQPLSESPDREGNCVGAAPAQARTAA